MVSDSTHSSGEDDVDVAMQRLVELHGLLACRQSLDKLRRQDKMMEDNDDSCMINVRRLLAKERKLNAAIRDVSVDVICTIDVDGTIRSVNNRAAAESFGYRETELVGQNISSLLVDNSNDGGGGSSQLLLHDDASGLIKTCRETGEGNESEVSAQKKDGTEFPALLRIERVSDDDEDDENENNAEDSNEAAGADEENKENDGPLFVALFRDRTNSQMAQRLQHQSVIMKKQNALSEKMKSAFLDAALDAIFAVGPVGDIVSVNRAGVEMFGYASESELIGKNIETIVDKGHVELAEEFMAAFRDEQQEQQQQQQQEDGNNAASPASLGTGTDANGSDNGGRKPKPKPPLRSKHELMCRRRNWSQFPATVGLEWVEPFRVAFVRDTSEEKKARELEIEVRSAEELLLNVLPEQIVDRLKADPSHLADHHANASILFADIVGFTAMSSKMQPLELVNVLNDLFTRFDGLVEEYGLNKVKTIGDCYMVTSIPHRSDGRKACAAICYFAMDMIAALKQFNEDNPENVQLGLRVGINCGDVVAGVVGTNRFLYDLWGDAVNIASRMESTGTPLRIQVSKAVVDLAPVGEFKFEARGEIAVKGKGMMETYFLVRPLRRRDRNRLRKSLSEDTSTVRTISRRSLFRNSKTGNSRARGLMALIQGSRRGGDLVAPGFSMSFRNFTDVDDDDGDAAPPASLSRSATTGGASMESPPPAFSRPSAVPMVQTTSDKIVFKDRSSSSRRRSHRSGGKKDNSTAAAVGALPEVDYESSTIDSSDELLMISEDSINPPLAGLKQNASSLLEDDCESSSNDDDNNKTINNDTFANLAEFSSSFKKSRGSLMDDDSESSANDVNNADTGITEAAAAAAATKDDTNLLPAFKKSNQSLIDSDDSDDDNNNEATATAAAAAGLTKFRTL